MTKTQTTSLETLSEALANHGWQFTVEAATVRVPDESVDYSSRYSSRRRLGRKDAPGFAVRIDNGVTSTSRYDSDRVSTDLYFTEDGRYIAEMTRDAYPVRKGMPLKDVLALVAERSKAEHERKQAVLAERNEAYAAEQIAKADAEVEVKAEAASAAAAPALEAVIAITGLPEHVARSVLDALVGDQGQPIQAFGARLWEVNQAREQASRARADYQRKESNGFL